MNGYAIGRQNGWMSANDIRELENLDRIPEIEDYKLIIRGAYMAEKYIAEEQRERCRKVAGAFSELFELAILPPTLPEGVSIGTC